MAREIVIHPKRPSGTLATKIPIPKTIESTQEYPTANLAAKKKTTPKLMAIIVIIKTNLSNSILRGVFTLSPPDARSAIYPKTVFSPIFTTIPFPYPSLHKVPKKAMFAVSNTLLLVHLSVLNKGSDSPVNAELSTFISRDDKILTSAGILSPDLIAMISPGTNF